jgi:hypothetical protein
VRCTWLVPVLVAVTSSGCQKDRSDGAEPPKPTDPGTRKLAGVFPDKFECKSILTLEELGQILNGSAHDLDSALSVPRGLPHPCTYEVTVDGQAEYWTFDFDCRDGMKQRADALFEQYRTGSTQLIEQYNTLSDAGAIKPNDAGIPTHPPEPAVEVDVGAKGLDHHGQALIFIDDDAPCYVRVIGPGAPRRLALAKALAKHLTFANAPMTPRPMP